MITFGLTGGIASGKSTVTKTLREHQIPMVDADKVARDVVVPGSKGLATIVEHFGTTYILPDGTLDRTGMGQLVFASKDALNLINKIMFPLIREEAEKQLQALHMAGHYLVGYDAALICEMGSASLYRPLVVVACTQENQLARLMKRNTLTEAEAMARIATQMPVEQKIAMADFIIDTNGTIEQSIAQTNKIVDTLRKMV
jgi:dephospho-CoA kinase